MGIIELLLISTGLAMDAFAISVCKGLSMKKIDIKKVFIVALYFSFFQAFMPLVGYLLSSSFEKYIINIDHWIAFIILFMIGFNMIRDTFSNNKEKMNEYIDFKTMFPLSIATSIDALAVGITFSFFKINILFAIFMIGIITFLLSIIGVILGIKFGTKYENKAGFIGGIILLLIGLKILLDHLKMF